MHCKPSNFFLNTNNSTLTLNTSSQLNKNSFKTTLLFSISNSTLTSPKIWVKQCKDKSPQYTNNINLLNMNIQKCLIQLYIKSINDNGENVNDTIYINNYENIFYSKNANQYYLTIELVSDVPFNIHDIYNIPEDNIVFCNVTAIYA